jgi:hypothetical protein
MFKALRLSAPMLAFLIAACGGASSPAPSAPSSSAAPAAAEDPSCPVAIAGTSVTVEDTDTGAALTFVTTGDVAELRARVGRMAQMHNEQHGKMGPLPTGTETAGHDHAAMGHDHAAMGHGSGNEHAGHAGGMISVHSAAKAEDIEGGARLVFTVAASDVNTIRDELRMHAQHMSAGTCAMSHE